MWISFLRIYEFPNLFLRIFQYNIMSQCLKYFKKISFNFWRQLTSSFIILFYKFSDKPFCNVIVLPNLIPIFEKRRSWRVLSFYLKIHQHFRSPIQYTNIAYLKDSTAVVINSTEFTGHVINFLLGHGNTHYTNKLKNFCIVRV